MLDPFLRALGYVLQDDHATSSLLSHAKRWQATSDLLTRFPRNEVVPFLGTLMGMQGGNGLCLLVV